jgi:hypothetical protein
MWASKQLDQFPNIKSKLEEMGVIHGLKLVPSSRDLVVIEEYLNSLNKSDFEIIHEVTFDRSSHVCEVRSLTPREVTIVFLNANKMN